MLIIAFNKGTSSKTMHTVDQRKKVSTSASEQYDGV